MTHDMATLGRDLRDRIDHLVREVERLREENERLARENRELREEVTLFRFVDAVDDEPGEPPSRGTYHLPPWVSSEAMGFYDDLPDRFDVVEFFRLAEVSGVDSTTARSYMLLFFREEMLQGDGARIMKTGTTPYLRRVAQ